MDNTIKIMISREKEMMYKFQLHFSSGYWQVSSHLGFCTSLATLGRGMLCFGEGNGTPFQYSCLENPMDGGAW